MSERFKILGRASILTAIFALLCSGCGETAPATVILESTSMLYADSVRTQAPFAKDPTVVHVGDRYLMYYSAREYEEGRKSASPGFEGWHSAVAQSRDLVNWSRVGDLDITDTKGNPVWGAIAPCGKVFDGVVHLFYQKFSEEEGRANIWHAVSTDGIKFTNSFDGPVFVPRTDWSVNRSIDAEVYRVKDKMILVFATRDTSYEWQILGMAQAPYGSDYGPDKWTLVSTDGPLLKPEYEWEGHCIEAATVVERNGFYYMFYAGAYNHEHQQIGLAVSRDGYNFERINPESENPGLCYRSGAEGSWNYGESGHPGIFEDNDGSLWLFYQGKASQDADYFLSSCKVFLKN